MFSLLYDNKITQLAQFEFIVKILKINNNDNNASEINLSLTISRAIVTFSEPCEYLASVSAGKSP